MVERPRTFECKLVGDELSFHLFPLREERGTAARRREGRRIHNQKVYSSTRPAAWSPATMQPVYIFTKFKINQNTLIDRNSNNFFLLKNLILFNININFNFSNYFFLKNNNISYKKNFHKIYRHKTLNVLLHEKYFQIKNVNNIKKQYFYKCIFKNTSVSFFQQFKVIYHFLELENFLEKKVIFNMNYVFISTLNFFKKEVLKNLKLIYINFYFPKLVQNKKKISFKLILNNYIKNLIINCLLKLINIYFYSFFKNLILNTKNYLVKKILIRNSNKPLSVIINFNNFYNRFFNLYFLLLNYYFSLPNLSNQICNNLLKNLILRTLNYTVLIKKKNYNFDNSKEFKKNIIYTPAWNLFQCLFHLRDEKGLKPPIKQEARDETGTDHVSEFTPHVLMFSGPSTCMGCSRGDRPRKLDHAVTSKGGDHVSSTMQIVISNKLSKTNQQTSIINKFLSIIKKKHNNKSNSWVLDKYLFKTFYKLLFIKTEYQNFNKLYITFNTQKLTFFKKKSLFLKLKKKSNNYSFKNILVKNNIFLTYYVYLI